jgi:NAD(P)H-nitrite reductase large subunit
MRYVIIGNSAAAVGCITGIRSIDRVSSITIMSDELYHTYSRPLISYWLQGKVTDENMYYRGLNFYENNCCKTIFGKKAVKIDTKSKEVVLDDKTRIGYDMLLVASGSSPFVPPVDGLEGRKNIYTFMTWQSVKDIKAAIKKKSRVIILGAGLIGLKAAEGLHNTCEDITVVDLADRVLPSILDADGASLVQKHIEGEGIKIILNDAAAKVTDNTLILKSGKELSYDMLIVAVGVRPNTSLVKDAGGAVNRGITTDEGQRTSISGIFAAGDCVESYDISSGQPKILALLPNAYMQGEVAGINMAGGDAKFDKALPMNAIGFFGLHMITAGSMDGETLLDKKEGGYKKMVFADGRLKGFILIGDIDRAGIYTSLIRDKVPVESVDRKLLVTKPQLLIFDKETRNRKLNGGVQ